MTSRSKPRALSLPPASLAPGPERRHVEARQRLVQRVRSEFLEMPGLRLTLAQAERLFALDHARCQRVLDECVRAGWLRLGPLGEYGLDEMEP